MANHVPFDKYETAVLINACIRVRNGEILKQKAIEDVSKTLRCRALNKGLHISDSFRSVAGISAQFSVVNLLLDRQHVDENHSPKVFLEVIEIYHSNKPEFDAILQEEKSVDLTTDKDRFIQWLSKKVSVRRVNKYVLFLSRIDEFAKNKRLCEGTIYAVSDIAIIDDIMKAFISDRSRFFLSKKKMRVAREAGRLLDEYVRERYCQTISTKIKAVVVSDQNEALEKPNISNSFSADGDEVAQRNVEEAQNVHAEFINSMERRGLSEMVSNIYALALDDVTLFARQKDFLEGSVYELNDIDEIVAFRNKLFNEPSFWDFNRRKRYCLDKAVEQYLLFRMGDNANEEEQESLFSDISKEGEGKLLYEFDVKKKNRLQRLRPKNSNRGNGKSVRTAFINWMVKHDNIPKMDALTYASSIAVLDEFMLSRGISFELLFNTRDSKTIHTLKKELFSLGSFRSLDLQKHRALSIALRCYISFANKCSDGLYWRCLGKEEQAVRKDFIDWASKRGLAESTSNTYFCAIRHVDAFAWNYHSSKESIFTMVDVKEIEALWKNLLSDPLFMVYDSKSGKRFVNPMRWYIDFRTPDKQRDENVKKDQVDPSLENNNCENETENLAWSIQSLFEQWLTEQGFTRYLVNSYIQSIRDADLYAINNSYPKVPIFEIRDPKKIDDVLHWLTSDDGFRSYKKGMRVNLAKALKQYILFITSNLQQDNLSDIEEEEQNNLFSANLKVRAGSDEMIEDETDLLNENKQNLTNVQDENQNTEINNREEEPQEMELKKELDIHNQTNSLEETCEEVDMSTEFIEWGKSMGYPQRRIDDYMTSLIIANNFAQDHGLTKISLFEISDSKIIRELTEKLRTDKVAYEFDRRNNFCLSVALRQYEFFLANM